MVDHGPEPWIGRATTLGVQDAPLRASRANVATTLDCATGRFGILEDATGIAAGLSIGIRQAR